VLQHLELPGTWLERGRIDATDTALLDSPLGLAGQRVMGTLWCAAGSALDPTLRQQLLDAAREVAAGHALDASCGATSPSAQVVVCRALAPRVEPLFELWRAIRAVWRPLLWGLDARPPRIWAM